MERAKGFTLVEVLVAVALVAVALVPLALRLREGSAWLALAGRSIQAADLLQQAAEETKALPYADVVTLSSPEDYPSADSGFQLTRTVTDARTADGARMLDSDGEVVAKQVALQILRRSDGKVMADCTFLVYRDGGY
ncbi:MAG TPA: prepilin-type N-terminal cleavage/methylation domain-containing protein [Firmicutes bacterium]|nr:prepilin-type N-terminal cleavage/methylation domain-containing protein [Bacillota bacterium]